MHTWCSLCALFLQTKENTCPCCKTRLITKARSKLDELPRMIIMEKANVNVYARCSISKIGPVYCILPVLGYRQIKRILRNRKKTDKKIQD